MKKIFLDTNFIIDFMLREEYRPLCKKILDEGDLKGKWFYISFLSVANFAYIARKVPFDLLYRYLQLISDSFIILDHNKDQLDKAISLKAKDFEDALQFQCAKQAACECIITRNKKDFNFSDLPVFTPKEFLNKYLI